MFALRCGLLGALVTLGSYAGQPVELAAAANAPSLAQIHGVYAWMSPDATRANLLMTIAATDASATTFADDVQYVFHVSTYESFAQPPVTTTNVICQFANAGDLECWVGASYVRGNPSSTTGLVSENLLIRIFAGRRSDPMAFNRDGFDEAMRRLREAAGGLAGACPALPPAGATQIVEQLALAPDGAGPARDAYAASNVLALTIQVDKRLLGATSRASLISVWGSTHRR